VAEHDHPAFGRPELRAWREYQVKGNLIAARPRYVREKWGEAGLRDVASRLSPEARALFESSILPFTWHPFPVMAAIDAALLDGPMGSDAARMQEFGATIARYDLPTLYKVLFKLGTPSFILKRVAVVYGTYIKGGEMTPLEVTASSARIRLSKGALPLYFCAYGVTGWFTAAVEMSGGKDVRAHQSRCVHEGASACEWEASWS
jgi:predicted hydrocarbon binding protein